MPDFGLVRRDFRVSVAVLVCLAFVVGFVTAVPFSDMAAAESSHVVGVAAGDAHSLAVASDGTVWAWGSNEFGQLGDGSNSSSAVPVQVSGLADVRR